MKAILALGLAAALSLALGSGPLPAWAQPSPPVAVGAPALAQDGGAQTSGSRPPAQMAPPVPDDDTKSWCRTPDGLIAECKVGETPFGPPDAYPERALENEIEGVAIISCTITNAQGKLNCTPVAETPYGYGFGAAAAKMGNRSFHLVSPQGYDLTGFAHSMMVPFLLDERPDLATWRDFLLARDLNALAGDSPRNHLPPQYASGFEQTADQVNIRCAVTDTADHVQCTLISESDPDMRLGAGVIAQVNAVARLRAAPDSTASTIVVFPYPALRLATSVSDADIAAAYPEAQRGRKPSAQNGFEPTADHVTLRCVVQDAEGRLACTLYNDEFPAFGIGEALRPLYQEKARVTIEDGAVLVGRVLKVDIAVPFQ